MSVMSMQNSADGTPVDRRKFILAIGTVVVSVGLLVFVILRATLLSGPQAGDVSRHRTLIDAETGEVVFGYHVQDGTLYPWVNPKSGKATLYPPESCFWTRDGKAKAEPTYVLLNEMAGKTGPTICPDCGRTVVARNPKPPMDMMIEAFKAAAAKK